MLDKNRIKTVFVDVDDTIWAFSENSKASLRHVYDCFDVKRWAPEYDTFKDVYLTKNAELWDLYHHGKISRDFLLKERFRFTLSTLGCDENLDVFCKQIDDEYLRFLSLQSTLIPGAQDLLEYLNSHYEVHALSNGFKGIQQQKLRSASIEHLIDKVIISDDCGITKPMRGIFDYALEQCGASAETSVMIGDNPDADIAGAHNAGWQTIFFDYKKKGSCAEADATVATLEEIKKIL